MDYVILLWHSLSLPYNYFETKPADENDERLSEVKNKIFKVISLCQFWHYKLDSKISGNWG